MGAIGRCPRRWERRCTILADHKMAAAAYVVENTIGKCPIAFAGDTDWHGWEQVLAKHGIIA
jgi:hypothetical protein